jgi:hypothetical protein
MIPADGERLGVGQRQLEFARQFVHAHGGNVGAVPGEKKGGKSALQHLLRC